VTYGVEHIYVYSFLDDKPHGRGRVAAYIFGILALCIIVFVIVHFAIVLRNLATKRRTAQTSGKLEHKGVSRTSDLEMGKA
jgi:phosphotransferase system  glucose/maltose/N-acetylglucosamine-specific IIC component